MSECGIFLRLYIELFFTSVPICDALQMIREHLNVSDLSHDISVLTEPSVGTALFEHKLRGYLHFESAAMRSLFSPLLANMFMTASEEVIGFSQLKPRCWNKYVFDSYAQ
jgi:hypothetical protein